MATAIDGYFGGGTAPWREGARERLAPGVLIAAAVAVLALPSALLAFSNRVESGGDAADDQGSIGFSGSAVDPRLARAIAAQTPGAVGGAAVGGRFRFTPAGFFARPDRSVTVAVRVDPATESAIRTIIVRLPATTPAMRMALRTGSVASPPLHVVSTAYSLGAAREAGLGLSPQSFSLPGDSHRLDQPDLRGFTLTDSSATSGSSNNGGRLAPHIQLNEREHPGGAPRTLDSAGEQTVDLGGRYRLSRNLDVTAGVRYSQERDRPAPVSDGKQTDQAVFVGTQFHF